MRVVRYHNYGDPNVLMIEEAPVPTPGPGQVLIRAQAIGVNFVETQRRRGTAPFPTPLPNAPHGDVLGIVEAVGPAVTTVEPGDRVCAIVEGEAFADFVVADATWLAPIPHTLGLAEASVLASPAQTALSLLKAGRLEPGETVLVHAAAGAIGHLVSQLAKIMGAGMVIGTASSPAKLEFARAHGADVAIDYSRPDWADQVRTATADRGVDVVLDSIGGAVFDQGISLLAPLGRMVFYGVASGIVPQINPMQLISPKYVTGSALRQWRLHHPEEVKSWHAQLVEYFSTGQLRVSLHAALPFTDIAKAHAICEGRSQLGRLLITV